MSQAQQQKTFSNGRGASGPARAPLYNMKAVVMETGINATTIRAWERRYGLPDPQRTAGGHRQYSLRDIQTLKWLTARQDEGMSISHAVELWQRLEADGRDPLRHHEAGPPPPEPYTPPPVAGNQIDALRQAWIKACLRLDRRQAEQVLNDAFGRFAPETVVVELLQKGMVAIGLGWYRGDYSIQQEHFASELTLRRLETLIAGTLVPTRPEQIVIACAPEDQHTISPLFLNYLLRRDGWDVLFLGANVPALEIARTASQVDSDLVIVSAQQLQTAATLAEAARRVSAAGQMVAYGGSIFNYLPPLRQYVAGHFLGQTLVDVPRVVARLLEERPPTPETPPIGPDYRRALRHFRQRRALIESHVWASYVANGWSDLDQDEGEPTGRDILTEMNRDVAESILAALRLGDMEVLPTDIDWLAHVLIGYRQSLEQVGQYIQVYRQAATVHLSEPGAPILDWLNRIG
ncbi:MAG: MerR family transcriptional regulator [Candidatus Promineifilaceae bacterium]|nr:MerR family transcriptional regulator [Candidatus Promineifilaceae bacterium]